MTMEPEQYTFNVNNEKLIDGPCFLTAIIDHTYTNTLTNTEAADENLASLAEYMEALSDSNVEKFNTYIKKQLKTLAARGEMTNDLISFLLKGHSKANKNRHPIIESV